MTVTDEDVYAYLEHHGVKGMRWGTRKARVAPSKKPPSQAERINAEVAKRKRHDRIVTGLAIGAMGLLVANQILASNRKKQMKSIAAASALKRAGEAGTLFSAYKKTPMSTVVRTGFAVSPSGSATPTFKRILAK